MGAMRTDPRRVRSGLVCTAVLVIGASLTPGFVSPVAAQDRGNPEWHWVAHPTLWFANVDAVIGLNDNGIEIGDTTLVASFSGEAEVGKGRWRAIGAFYSTSLDGPTEVEGPTIPDGTVADYDFKFTNAELFASVEFGSFETTQALELMGGIRYVDHKLDVAGAPGTLVARENWVEPVVGARYYAEMGRIFWATIDGNIGGFGIGSRVAWVIRGTLAVRVFGPVDLTLATRFNQTEYANSDTGYLWDEGMSQGWHLGVRIKG